MKKRKLSLNYLLISGIVLIMAGFILTEGCKEKETRGPNDSNGVTILALFAKNHGLNSFLNRDVFESYGWNIVHTGVTDTVSVCPPVEKTYGVSPVVVDIQVSEIHDVTPYDAVALMSGSGDYYSVPDPFGDIIGSPEALQLIRNAVDHGIPVWTLCSGVRALAAAGVIRGKTIIAPPKFKDEMLAAGAADVLPKDHYPVTDGSVITAARNLYYNFINCQVLITAVENRRDQKGLKKHNRKKWMTSAPADFSVDGLKWAYTYGGSTSEGARDVYEDSDGNLLITGYSFSEGSGDADILVIKTDSDGKEIWSKTFGGAGTEYGNDLMEVNDGYVVTGYTTSFGSGSKDVYLIKIDPNGKELWTKTYGGSSWDVGTGLCATPDGYMICGYTHSSGAGEEDFYLIKTDLKGNVLWEKTYGGERFELADSVCRTPDEGFLIGGTTGTFGKENADVYIVKTDTEGNEIWAKSFGVQSQAGYGFDCSSKMHPTDDGGCICAGYTDSADIMDAYVIKIDAQGNEEWHTALGNKPFYDYGYSVVPSPDGGFIMAGVTKAMTQTRHAYDNNMYIVKLDKDGQSIWEKSIGSSGTDWASDVIFTSDGNIVIVGHTDSFGKGKLDVCILKIMNENPHSE